MRAGCSPGGSGGSDFSRAIDVGRLKEFAVLGLKPFEGDVGSGELGTLGMFCVRSCTSDLAEWTDFRLVLCDRLSVSSA